MCVPAKKMGKSWERHFLFKCMILLILWQKKKEQTSEINYTSDLQTHFHALLEIRNRIKPHLIPIPQKNANLAKNTMYTLFSSVPKAPGRHLIPKQNNISREPRPKSRKDSHVFVLGIYHLPGSIFIWMSRIAIACHVNTIPSHNYFLNDTANNLNFPLQFQASGIKE